MRIGWLAGAVAVALAGCGGGGHADTIRGTVFLNGNAQVGVVRGELVDGGPCSGQGAYNDLAGGARVTVTNESGRTIGVSHLDAGVIVRIDEGAVVGRVFGCSFGFVVKDTPRARYYSLAVARRDPVTVARAEMESSGWSPTITLAG